MPYSLIDDDVSSVAPVRRPKTAYRGVSGLVSGHRYFLPEIGRWVSRMLNDEDGVEALVTGGVENSVYNGYSYKQPKYILNIYEKTTFLLGSNIRVDVPPINLTGSIRCSTDCEPIIVGCDQWPAAFRFICEEHENLHIQQLTTYQQPGWCVYDEGTCSCPGAGTDANQDASPQMKVWPDLECPAYELTLESFRQTMKSGTLSEEEFIRATRGVESALDTLSSHGCPGH